MLWNILPREIKESNSTEKSLKQNIKKQEIFLALVL